MIPILPASAWREFRGTASPPGQNLTTHQALIAGPDGREHKCFVKAAPHGNAMPFTEAIGWGVAEALDLPRPGFAAVLVLPVQKLRQHMKLDQHWLGYTHTLAFCASTVTGRHIQSRWQWVSRVRKAKAFKHPDLPRIAAFDTWVENQDRHTGNFLQTKDGDYVPIDNEFILYTLMWAANITVGHQSLRNEAHALLKVTGYKRFEGSMVLASKLHEAAFQKAAPALQQFIHAMHSDPAQGIAVATAILHFLEQRAHPDWLANELGCIP
ncbi:HipA family kinase [Rhodoferax sp.]|uniref:HipA family kinase n=1 Tax=Rhodoferax sp. TaxID=50421 RepID=UPI00345BADA8